MQVKPLKIGNPFLRDILYLANRQVNLSYAKLAFLLSPFFSFLDYFVVVGSLQSYSISGDDTLAHQLPAHMAEYLLTCLLLPLLGWMLLSSYLLEGKSINGKCHGSWQARTITSFFPDRQTTHMLKKMDVRNNHMIISMLKENKTKPKTPLFFSLENHSK